MWSRDAHMHTAPPPAPSAANPPMSACWAAKKHKGGDLYLAQGQAGPLTSAPVSDPVPKVNRPRIQECRLLREPHLQGGVMREAHQRSMGTDDTCRASAPLVSDPSPVLRPYRVRYRRTHPNHLGHSRTRAQRRAPRLMFSSFIACYCNKHDVAFTTSLISHVS